MVLNVAEQRNRARGLALPRHAASAAAGRARHPRRLVIASLLGGAGFVGWIIALAIRLPARHQTDHWNVAWVGFDILLLISLLAAAWVFARRPHLVPTVFAVAGVLLACDAWFDVTTASGTGDIQASMLWAAAVELPLAGAMAWAARRQLRREQTPTCAKRIL